MVATPKRTEIEGETLLQVIRELRASKPSGGWSEIARRACVKKRRLMPSACGQQRTELPTRARAVCVPNGGMAIKAGQGKGSERTFGLAARGVGFATAAVTTTTTANDGSLRESGASGRASKQHKQGATGMTHEVGPGYAGCRSVGRGWRRRWWWS